MRTNVQTAKAPNEQSLASMSEAMKSRAKMIVEDDDCMGLAGSFARTTVDPATSRSSKGARAPAQPAPKKRAQGKAECPVAASINQRRLTLRNYNSVVASLTLSAEQAEKVLREASGAALA